MSPRFSKMGRKAESPFFTGIRSPLVGLPLRDSSPSLQAALALNEFYSSSSFSCSRSRPLPKDDQRIREFPFNPICIEGVQKVLLNVSPKSILTCEVPPSALVSFSFPGNTAFPRLLAWGWGLDLEIAPRLEISYQIHSDRIMLLFPDRDRPPSPPRHKGIPEAERAEDSLLFPSPFERRSPTHRRMPSPLFALTLPRPVL